MGKQGACANCGQSWEWDCDQIFNFEVPIGKRVWPAICPLCRTDLEEKFKTGKLSYNELILEFSSISARSAKRCAGLVKTDVIRINSPGFSPRRRGKH